MNDKMGIVLLAMVILLILYVGFWDVIDRNFRK